MSSTRNKNCTGDYELEQHRDSQNLGYNTYESYGKPQQTLFAGDGLLMGRMVSKNLSNNACDIESQLFGIGTTNLVSPKSEVMPDLKPIRSLNVIDRLPVIVPENLTISSNQRPNIRN